MPKLMYALKTDPAMVENPQMAHKSRMVIEHSRMESLPDVMTRWISDSVMISTYGLTRQADSP
jgi:hypothetical protein